jgi:succinoglycan biosynthesis transport protein ExoP
MARAGEPHMAAGAEADGGTDLLGLLDLIARRKWLILGTTVLVVALALGALSVIGPRYKATARLLIDPRELRVVENEVVARDLAGDMVLVESQVEIITSEAVLRRVVERENLVSDTDFYKPATGGDSGRTPAEVAIEGLARATKVTRPENTYVLEIAVTARQPAKSARLANAIAEAYTQDQAAAASGNTLDLSTSIGGRLEELQAQVKADEEKVSQFKTQYGVSTPDGRLLLDTRLNDLSARLSVAVGESAQAKSRLDVMQTAMAQRGDVSSVLSETENATMVGLRATLAEAQRNLAERQQVLGPRHPRVSAAQAELERAQRAIRAESERLVAATRDAWRAAQETEQSLAASLKQLTDQSFAANDRLIELRELERQAQASRLVYESYLVRAKETAELGNIGPRSARLIAPAAVPDRPAFPPRSMLAAAALVFGLGLGLFNAIVADLLAKRRAQPVVRTVFAPARPATRVEPTAADNDSIAVPATGASSEDRVIMTFAMDDEALAAGAALDLARGMADEGWSTLLVDLAESSAEPGLADLARGDAPAAAALARDPVSGAHLLDAGTQPQAADQTALASTLALLAETYDRVVINAGRLHGTGGGLAAAAIGICEHALLVVPGAAMTRAEHEAYEALAATEGLAVSVLSLAEEDGLPAAA